MCLVKEDCFHLGVKALIQNENNQILLLKVNLAKLKGTKEAYWDIPGGRVQQGDDVVSTLRRELKEETGITNIKQFTPFSMVLSNIRIPVGDGDVGLILAAYLCEAEKDSTINISDEHTEYRWFAPVEAAQLLRVKYPPEFTEKLIGLDR
jgi:8-oxo-dGTP pyrophosphatase MutT (NUDIX family)